MKRIIVLIIVVVMNGCAAMEGPRLVPLKGDYSKVQNTFYTDKSKDEVWSKIVELFSTNGIGISLIDKSSGLIVSNKTSFIDSYTREDEHGRLINNKAFLVVEHYDNLRKDLNAPQVCDGIWNIRMFNKDGKTAININLTNIKAHAEMNFGTYLGVKAFDFNSKSTGSFEKMIAESLLL